MRFRQAWTGVIAGSLVSLTAAANTAVVATVVERSTGKQHSLTLLSEVGGVVGCGLGGTYYFLYDSQDHQFYLVDTAKRLYARFDGTDEQPPVKRISPPEDLPAVADSLHELSDLIKKRSPGEPKTLPKPQVDIVREGTTSLPREFDPLLQRNIVRASCVLPVQKLPATVVSSSHRTRVDLQIKDIDAAPAWSNFRDFRLVNGVVMERGTLKNSK
jgi:hypothetical protein